MLVVVSSELTEMLPGILNQLGAESLSSLKKLASTVAGGEYLRKYTTLLTFFSCHFDFTPP